MEDRPPDPHLNNPLTPCNDFTVGKPNVQPTDAIFLEPTLKSTGQPFTLESPPPATSLLDENESKLNRPIDPSHHNTQTHEKLYQENDNTASSDRIPNSGQSPPRLTTNHDQNSPILIHQKSSTQQITHTHEVADQNNNYTAHIDQLKNSGHHPIKKNGVLTNPPPPTDHLNPSNNHRDHFPPLTSNSMSQNRKIQKPSSIDNKSLLPARQIATMAQNPVPTIQQLNSKFNPFHQLPAQTTQPNIVPSTRSNAVHNVRNVPPPSAPNIIPSYAARLKATQPVEEPHIEIHSPMITTKQGLPAVLFNREDFMVKLASNCRFTLIGKFSTTMPKMEVIRKCLTSQLQIKGNCKVTHFNSTHVYIDLDNEIDHSTVWNKERIYIEGRMMRLLVWTPTFTPQIETTIAPVWVVLPELPWHCYTMPFVTKLLEPIGRVLFFDVASIQKTRGSVAKVKVEIDITKPRPPHVWLGFPQEEGDVYGDGRWQELQFESIPDYCNHCKRQGHSFHHCKVRIREEEYQKRNKDQEEKDKDNPIQNSSSDQQRHQPEPPSQKMKKPAYERGQTSKAPVNLLSDTKVAGPNDWQTQKKKAFKGAKNHLHKLSGGQECCSINPIVEVLPTVQPRQEGCDATGVANCRQRDQPPVITGDVPIKAIPCHGSIQIMSGSPVALDQITDFDATVQSAAQFPVTVSQKNGVTIDFPSGKQLQNNEAILVAHSQLNPLAQLAGVSITTPTPVPGNVKINDRLRASVGPMPSLSNEKVASAHLVDHVSTVNSAADHSRAVISAVQHTGIMVACEDDVDTMSSMKISEQPVEKQQNNVSDSCSTDQKKAGCAVQYAVTDIGVHHEHGQMHEEENAFTTANVSNGDKMQVVKLASTEYASTDVLANEIDCANSLADLTGNDVVAVTHLPQATARGEIITKGNDNHPTVNVAEGSTKAWIMRSFGTTPEPDKSPAGKPSAAMNQQTPSQPHDSATGRKKKKKKPEKNSATGTPKMATEMETTGELIQEEQTEEEVRKAKIRAWQDAILAKSYAVNPVIENIKEPLNVLENKATHSVPSQDSFDPSNAITMGRDDDAIENDRALTAYVSPAHSGNTLIPTATLEVMCKQASKVMKEVGRGFFPVTPQDQIDTETQEAPTYYLGDLFEESQKDQKKLSKEVKSKWNLDAPLFIPNALRQQETQVPVESVDSQDASTQEFRTGPSDEVLLQRMDLHDIRGLLHRQNSPPHELPQKFSSPHPGIIEDGSEYEDEDEDSTAYNKMAEARYAGLSPRFEQDCKPKLIKKKRRPLEIPKKKEAAPKKQKRVQPTRSSKSRSSRRK